MPYHSSAVIVCSQMRFAMAPGSLSRRAPSACAAINSGVGKAYSAGQLSIQPHAGRSETKSGRRLTKDRIRLPPITHLIGPTFCLLAVNFACSALLLEPALAPACATVQGAIDQILRIRSFQATAFCKGAKVRSHSASSENNSEFSGSSMSSFSTSTDAPATDSHGTSIFGFNR